MPAFLSTCLPPCLSGRVPARPISVSPHPPRLPPTHRSPRTPPGPVLRRPLSDVCPTLPTPSLLHVEELLREHVPLEAGPCGDVPREQVLPREDVRCKDVPRENEPLEELSRENVPLEAGLYGDVHREALPREDARRVGRAAPEDARLAHSVRVGGGDRAAPEAKCVVAR